MKYLEKICARSTLDERLYHSSWGTCMVLNCECKEFCSAPIQTQAGEGETR